MIKNLKAMRPASLLVVASFLPWQVQAKDEIVGVSWSNFQEERWKKDESAIKAALAAAGAKYISADAQGSNEKQLADIEALIAKGAKVLIILAQDASAILPAVNKAKEAKVPVVAYDRLIQDSGVLYLTFDNVEVGRMQARAVLAVKPKGNYVFIKGSPTDPNADFLNAGQREVLKPAMDKGDIKIVGEQYTDGWAPENAQKNMEQILTRNANRVDAVVASNDGTAGGVVAALRAQNLVGVPVSGQDADIAALNRVARGEQTVSVWKDARELGKAAGTYAAQMAVGTKLANIPGAAPWNGGSRKLSIPSIFLKPIPVTQDNLKLVLDAGWATKAQVCAGVIPAKAPAVCK
ncbi:MAG: D-xylose ABC transporter substrate-binding protein [Comamonadaceae bacterium PBBC2]|nr:MAG: D-xylose ABC transporter substrate-binding protein [Comamonadaceae bacterium PBBC2]